MDPERQALRLGGPSVVRDTLSRIDFLCERDGQCGEYNKLREEVDFYLLDGTARRVVASI